MADGVDWQPFFPTIITDGITGYSGCFIDVDIANIPKVIVKHGCFSRVLLTFQPWNVHWQ
jgi:hypothetical protein